MTPPAVVAFDVNETLSDLEPLRELFIGAGLSGEMLDAWFAATLRDGFALTVTGNIATFAELGAGALRPLLSGRDCTRAVDELTDAVIARFSDPPIHHDVAAGLRDLREANIRVVTLSNGSASVADGLLERAGLRDLVELTLTVADAGRWKPAAEAYRYAAQRCGVPIEQIALVAVHPWDTDGAKRAGMKSAWLNRKGVPYPPAFTAPDVVGNDLPQLVHRLRGSL